MNELLLCDEVDKIIRKRLRIPSYATWRKKELKRLKEQEEFRRPEHWGVRPGQALAREMHLPADSRVLVAGTIGRKRRDVSRSPGLRVTTIDPAGDVEVPFTPEDAALLAGRVAKLDVSLRDWSPEEQLSAVVCTPAAFAGLTAAQRAKVIEVLQSATRDGGVHLVDTIIAGRNEPSLSELEKELQRMDHFRP